jgi:O-antigen ligase
MHTKIVNNNNLRFFFTKHQSNIAIFLALAMVYGFLAGRAILSSGMFLFFVNAIWNTKPKDWWQQKWWLLGLSWVALYALSFFWSTDIPYWQERFQVKYAFIIFPLAMGCLPKISINNLKILTWGIIVLAVGGCAYSLHFYFADAEHILNNYFKSKVFKTPAYKDHIRFSVFIAWVIVWCSYMFPKMTKRIEKVALIITTAFLAVYLHILAVRSGLLFLYSFAFLYVIFLFIRKRFMQGGLIVLSIVVAVFVLFQSTPSFREKIYYGIYSINEYRQGNETADYSDIGRIISYKLASKIIVKHPLIGIGAGDVREEMKKQYELFSPDTKPEQMIVPHNQIMEVTLVGGIVTLTPFLIWLLYPIKKMNRSRGSFYIMANWFGLFLCIMVEAMLEMQFGVFVYLFAMLWIQKAVQSDEDTIPLAPTS